MSDIQWNSRFIPEVQRATMSALGAAADEAVKEAKRGIAPHSSSAARAVKRFQPRLTGQDPTVPITIGKGLGRIFEFSKQQNRRLKGRGKYRAGTNRGVMKRVEFFNQAVERVQREGLDLRRYL